MEDGRGRHANHKTEEEKEKFVIEHITMYKVIESHYVRKESKYEYLPCDLSIAEMYRMYNEWCLKKNYPEVTILFYSL